MKFKKIISVISALAIVITSSLTVQVVSASGDRTFPFPLEDYVGKDIPEGEYGVEGAENVKYIFTFDDAGTPNAQVSTEYATDGTRSLIMGAKGTANKQQGLGAGFTLKFGNPTADGKYDISFDVWIEGGNYRDYAALNNDGWDGKAQLSDANTNTQWTMTTLGAGQAVGGVGEGTWIRYTATLSTTADDPQLNFALRGDVLHLDNIIIKDTSGNLLFAESFEAAAEAEPDDDVIIRFPFEDYIDEYAPAGDYAVEGAENVIYHIRTNGADTSVALVRTADASDGARSFRIRSANTDPLDRTLCTEFTIEFGNPTADGKYVISFDAWREVSDWRDYATLNYADWNGSARLTDTTKWAVTELGKGQDIGGVGTGTWSRYTATLSTIADDPQINFAVAGPGELHIDNIVVKDTNGNLLFAESFETSGPTIGAPTEPEEPEEPGYSFPFEDYIDEYAPAGDYAVEGAENVIYHIRTNGADTSVALVRTADASDGARSFRIRSANTDPLDRTLCTEFTIEFGNPTADGKYVISFDAWREVSDWRDYATLNYADWNGSARLTDTTKWAVTELGKGQDIGGVGTGTWSRYTATLSTIADDPQINFAVAGPGELHIDNIVVKDTSGNLLFAESFETSGPTIGAPTEPEEPEEPGYSFPFEDYIDEYAPAGDYAVEGAENVIYHIRTNGADTSVALVRTADASDGARSFRIRSANTDPLDRTLCTEFTIEFGNPTADGKYVISFDAWREVSDWRDYATLNYADWNGSARLTDTTKWAVTELGKGQDIGGVGTGTWSRYTATLSTIADDPQINFAVAGPGELHIDNIVVKDSSGNLLFAESFETSGPTIGAPTEPEEPEEPGYSFPFEDYIDEYAPAGDYAVEGAENVIYHIRTNGADTSVALVRTADASDGARSFRIRSANTDPLDRTLCTEFTIEFGNATADGKYVISFDAWREVSDWRDYATLNYADWNGSARLTDTTKWAVTELGKGQDIGGVGTGTWSRYTATLSTIADDPQINFAVAGPGELHIDNIVVKDSSGNLLFAESFETSGPTIGAPTEPEEPEEPEEPGYSFPFEDYIDEYIPVGDYAIEGTENVVYYIRNNGANDTSVAIVRTADASHGVRSFRIRSKDTTPLDRTLCTEFTIKFGNATADGKYVISFDAWREVSDYRDYAALNYDGWDGPARLKDTTKWNVEYLGLGQDIGGVGTGEWSRYTATLSTTADDPQLNFAVAGRGELHIDNIVVKDSNGNILLAESFETSGPTIGAPAEPEEPENGIIYDAEFKIVKEVDNQYSVVEDATNLTANTFVMSVVKVEGRISANVYTALYKDNCLVSFDHETVSAGEGVAVSGGTVLQIPSLSDGEYSLKVFVWDEESAPIKDAKVLGE